ncbi:unnamed protein product [Durusdinium trenchii]|uniref:Uncharacterized protein n=1 Tax=Durusdinium trenchii TaxID=1381693 RepID=A0ABP0JMD7_9DINO
MDSKGGHSYLRIRHALLRIGFMDGITLQECKKVLGGSMSEKVIEAEDLCTEIRALCQKHAVSPEAMREVLLFEHEIIKVLLDKKGHAESVQHCAHDLVVRVKEVDGREITNKWNTMRSYDTKGKLVDGSQLVLQMGFQVGCHIVRKQDEVLAKIVEFSGDLVKLNVTGGMESGIFTVHMQSFLNKEWKVYTPKKEVEFWKEHWVDHGLHHDSFREGILRGKVMLALTELGLKHQDVLKGLDVILKPCKGVQAKKAFAPGKCILVPLTFKLTFADEAKTLQSGAVSLGPLSQNSCDQIIWGYLLPCQILPTEERQGFIAPFWSVACSSEKDETNMELVPKNLPDQSHKGLETVAVTIPIMKNCRKIEPGENLVCFKEEKSQPVELQPLVPESAPKRMRTKGKS